MNILFIINPKSKHGSSKTLREIIQRKFSSHRIEISHTLYPGHATAIAMQSTQKKFDTIVAVGGDGTINEVLNGIVNRNVVLGIIPMGTANDLASLYQISSNIESACNVILERHIHQSDLISVNGRYFVTAGGLGLPADVTVKANTIKQNNTVGKLMLKLLGSKIYVLVVLLVLLQNQKGRQYVQVHTNGYSHVMDTLSLMVGNQPFLGKNFLMTPEAKNDDGLFDICWIKNSKTRMEVFSILLKVLTGKHVDLLTVQTWQSEELFLRSEQALTFFGDGEKFWEDTQFHIRILPKSLNILVPVNSEGLTKC
jgi:diacylglycerol kinase (ATP)